MEIIVLFSGIILLHLNLILAFPHSKDNAQNTGEANAYAGPLAATTHTNNAQTWPTYSTASSTAYSNGNVNQGGTAVAMATSGTSNISPAFINYGNPGWQAPTYSATSYLNGKRNQGATAVTTTASSDSSSTNPAVTNYNNPGWHAPVPIYSTAFATSNSNSNGNQGATAVTTATSATNAGVTNVANPSWQQPISTAASSQSNVWTSNTNYNNGVNNQASSISNSYNGYNYDTAASNSAYASSTNDVNYGTQRTEYPYNHHNVYNHGSNTNVPAYTASTVQITNPDTIQGISADKFTATSSTIASAANYESRSTAYPNNHNHHNVYNHIANTNVPAYTANTAQITNPDTVQGNSANHFTATSSATTSAANYGTQRVAYPNNHHGVHNQVAYTNFPAYTASSVQTTNSEKVQGKSADQFTATSSATTSAANHKTNNHNHHNVYNHGSNSNVPAYTASSVQTRNPDTVQGNNGDFFNALSSSVPTANYGTNNHFNVHNQGHANTGFQTNAMSDVGNVNLIVNSYQDLNTNLPGYTANSIPATYTDIVQGNSTDYTIATSSASASTYQGWSQDQTASSTAAQSTTTTSSGVESTVYNQQQSSTQGFPEAAPQVEEEEVYEVWHADGTIEYIKSYEEMLQKYPDYVLLSNPEVMPQAQNVAQPQPTDLNTNPIITSYDNVSSSSTNSQPQVETTASTGMLQKDHDNVYPTGPTTETLPKDQPSASNGMISNSSSHMTTETSNSFNLTEEQSTNPLISSSIEDKSNKVSDQSDSASEIGDDEFGINHELDSLEKEYLEFAKNNPDILTYENDKDDETRTDFNKPIKNINDSKTQASKQETVSMSSDTNEEIFVESNIENVETKIQDQSDKIVKKLNSSDQSDSSSEVGDDIKNEFGINYELDSLEKEYLEFAKNNPDILTYENDEEEKDETESIQAIKNITNSKKDVFKQEIISTSSDTKEKTLENLETKIQDQLDKIDETLTNSNTEKSEDDELNENQDMNDEILRQSKSKSKKVKIQEESGKNKANLTNSTEESEDKTKASTEINPQKEENKIQKELDTNVETLNNSSTEKSEEKTLEVHQESKDEELKESHSQNEKKQPKDNNNDEKLSNTTDKPKEDTDTLTETNAQSKENTIKNELDTSVDTQNSTSIGESEEHTITVNQDSKNKESDSNRKENKPQDIFNKNDKILSNSAKELEKETNALHNTNTLKKEIKIKKELDTKEETLNNKKIEESEEHTIAVNEDSKNEDLRESSSESGKSKSLDDLDDNNEKLNYSTEESEEDTKTLILNTSDESINTEKTESSINQNESDKTNQIITVESNKDINDSHMQQDEIENKPNSSSTDKPKTDLTSETEIENDEDDSSIEFNNAKSKENEGLRESSSESGKSKSLDNLDDNNEKLNYSTEEYEEDTKTLIPNTSDESIITEETESSINQNESDKTNQIITVESNEDIDESHMQQDEIENKPNSGSTDKPKTDLTSETEIKNDEHDSSIELNNAKSKELSILNASKVLEKESVSEIDSKNSESEIETESSENENIEEIIDELVIQHDEISVSATSEIENQVLEETNSSELDALNEEETLAFETTEDFSEDFEVTADDIIEMLQRFNGKKPIVWFKTSDTETLQELLDSGDDWDYIHFFNIKSSN